MFTWLHALVRQPATALEMVACVDMYVSQLIISLVRRVGAPVRAATEPESKAHCILVALTGGSLVVLDRDEC